MKWQDRITIDPAIAAGHAVIKGTRVPVQMLIGALGGGDTIEDVCQAYNVTEDDVRAGLIYAAEVVSRERVRALPR
ncbi:MAG: DUF433 domain-containing protein [Dehalococcoidia bacterium]|nr:DUF433 domain-containing protein [Dehalococcoidia bacterium]